MMVIDRSQIDAAIACAPSEDHCRRIDKVLAERRRIARMRAAAAIRAGDDSPWLVLRVMSGRELTVRDALDAADIEVLVPMKMGKEMRKRHRVIPPQRVPVFVGYVFARCNIGNLELCGLLSFDDVIGLLGSNDNPFCVAADKVNQFNEKADKGYYDYEVPQAVFRRGMKVRIREGIFAGFIGEVITGGHKGKGDAVVDIDFLGGSTPAIMPLAILEPL